MRKIRFYTAGRGGWREEGMRKATLKSINTIWDIRETHEEQSKKRNKTPQPRQKQINKSFYCYCCYRHGWCLVYVCERRRWASVYSNCLRSLASFHHAVIFCLRNNFLLLFFLPISKKNGFGNSILLTLRIE